MLRDHGRGLVATGEICDASPYLRSAARFHGEPTDQRCPVCRRAHLTLVHFAYGEALRQSAGQARRLAELAELAATVDEFLVYVVEVCRGCGWNHLREHYPRGKNPDTGDEGVPTSADIGRRRGERPDRRVRTTTSKVGRDGVIATAGCDE
ncbi:hypothetical protein GCM10010124_37780 [Pilimelia terevasa]|uniref:DUF5318 domain-containing protein n=1 Tax=Pilimelia terevasa TaxID=53372 RepID=A0A8J3BVP7_9ACTN|nr:hypothetical protein GCM10010124_37780 [Pilimelia terevasa]